MSLFERLLKSDLTASEWTGRAWHSLARPLQSASLLQLRWYAVWPLEALSGFISTRPKRVVVRWHKIDAVVVFD